MPAVFLLIKGHGQVSDEAVPKLRAVITALSDVAANSGLLIRVDFSPAEETELVVAMPEPVTPAVSHHSIEGAANIRRASSQARLAKPGSEEPQV